ncbi:MAG: methyltransferase domain-containing protein [bacterium]
MRNGGNQKVGETPLTDVESEVLRRYGKGARKAESGLCCPTEYDRRYLDLLPKEILQKDYGCGDPSAYVREGETVIDLGSGVGKICYILSQKVGPLGSVIGVDFNDAMLSLSRKYIDEMGQKLGYRNIRFVKARIQDLALGLEQAQRWLDSHTIHSMEEISAYEAECERLRREEPLISDASVDVVVSNCVLNLVRPEEKVKLFSEIHRVLRRGGRAVISDIVCDEDPTPSILSEPELWSGCIAGAFREDLFLKRFEEAGFFGIEILSRQQAPWQVIEGIEFRSMTVRAFKGKEGPCLERNQAMIYKGPWKCVCDDDGHTLYRGRRMAVCDKTFSIMNDSSGPYSRDMVPMPPKEEIPLERAAAFDCKRETLRDPRETKGLEYRITTAPSEEPGCGPDCCC